MVIRTYNDDKNDNTDGESSYEWNQIRIPLCGRLTKWILKIDT